MRGVTLRGLLAPLRWRTFANAAGSGASGAGGAGGAAGGAKNPLEDPEISALLEAELVKRGEGSKEEEERRTTPFHRFVNNYKPASGEFLMLIFTTMMLSMSIKFHRQRGEALEREKRYEERIARVKYELAAIEARLGEELRTKVEELPATDNTTVKQFFLEQNRSEWLGQVVSKTVARAKEISKQQLEGDLWTDVDSTLPASGEPAKAEAGEKAVLY
jgi:hypothetical protein